MRRDISIRGTTFRASDLTVAPSGPAVPIGSPMATTHPTIEAVAAPRDAPNISDSRRVVFGLAPLLLLYALYSVVRFLVSDRGPIAGAHHARSVLHLERWLRIDLELGIQREVLPRAWLIHAANWYYAYGFLPVLVSCAVLGAWKAPAAFAWWRRVFAVSLALALVGYAFYPLTPPRLLPASYGYVDTLLRFGPRYYGDATGSSLFNLYGSIPSTVNVYAAMPSMHVAWSVVAAALFWIIAGRRRWATLLAILHPCLMAFAVVATANHYVVDVVAGLAVLLAAILIVGQWDQRLPWQSTSAVPYA
jgi:membrane-associated phospholipid phosphatase